MRKSTSLWLVLAACCGAVFFQVSQKIHDRRETIAAVNRKIVEEEESIRLLQAEWSYLNQPDRLESLSRKYLGLSPLKGSQFVALEEITERGAGPLPEALAKAAAAAQEAVHGSSKQKHEPKQNVARRRNINDIIKSLGIE